MSKHQHTMPGPSSIESMLAYFNIFDTDRSGKLPAWYFVSILRGMGEPLTRDDVDHLLREIRVDGDNLIEIEEFVRHMFDTSMPSE